MGSALSRITANEILTAFVVFVLASTAVTLATLRLYGYDQVFGENILVEVHGMLFDILVIGVFILWLNKRGEKHLDNIRYQDEIDDFRGWESYEASHRIAGNVRRLNRNGITRINLSGCFLGGADLVDANLINASLVGATLSKANLSRATLREANLSRANLREANLSRANLRDANLGSANLRDADLVDANLSGADLREAEPVDANLSNANLREANLGSANLWDANLSGADLRDANLGSANLRDANLSGADLSGAILMDVQILTIEQLREVQTLYGVIALAPELMEQIKEQCPQLLEEPKDEE